MRNSTLAAVGLLGSALGACRTGVELRYTAEPGAIRARHVEVRTDTEILRDETIVDGKRRPGLRAVQTMRARAGQDGPFPGTHETWRITDELVEASASGPVEVRRTYARMEGVYQATPLYSLSWEDDVNGVVLTVRADDEPGLADHAEHRLLVGSVPFDLDGFGLLPARHVAIGDTWDVDVASLPLASRLIDLRRVENARASCRLLAVDDSIAVIAFELAPEPTEAAPVEPGETDWVNGEEILLESRVETEAWAGSGELRWNLKHSRAESIDARYRWTHARLVTGRMRKNGADVPVSSDSELQVTASLEVRAVSER